ncbi:MAG TPA: carbohydrate porin [Bacteroidota bacterium]|nr:carbohydrate porin [Bacteroidota bacterium]
MKTLFALSLAMLLPAGASWAQDSTEALSTHFQLTVVQQAHAPFRAEYTGKNSLLPTAENVLSVTSTLFLGTRLWKGGEGYFDPELAGGEGVSGTTGIAGFPNGEIYRVDNPTPKVFIARFFLRQHFALGNETEHAAPDQNQLAGELPASRLTITAGRFSLTDIFDDNAFSHDARTQFLNWALWSGAAWDYAADTRGYDWGVAAELHRPECDYRFAAVMVPTNANGPYFDHNIGRAYSLNAEVAHRYTIGALDGRVHLIGFLNHAFMGNYGEALALSASTGSRPDIDATNRYSSKYGFVVSLEQPLGGNLGLFSRWSWNDGRTETWAFTEIDRSFQAGLALAGQSWGRNEDNAGAAWVINALSADHRDYLAAGGYGFIIGDGALSYAPEQIFECYYAARLFPSFVLTLDDQLVLHPAYNRDRGPLVHLVALRGHAEW